MIKPISFCVSEILVNEAIKSIPNIDSKLSLNLSTGNFFHDPWVINPIFKDTVWNEILNTIPLQKGEARLIRLKPETCYPKHADIDDRWHLSLNGECCYLIDLDNQQMYQTDKVGQWYEMDTSIRHTAANFGNIDRIQLVIRKLLKRYELDDPITVEIRSRGVVKGRSMFDNILSPWLNAASKKGIISNVEHNLISSSMKLEIEKEYLKELIDLINHTNLELHVEF